MRRKMTMMPTMISKKLKQSDTEPLNHGDGNENVNDQSICNRQLPRRSAAIDADWRRCVLNQSDNGND